MSLSTISLLTWIGESDDEIRKANIGNHLLVYGCEFSTLETQQMQLSHKENQYFSFGYVYLDGPHKSMNSNFQTQTRMMCHDSDLASGRWHDPLPTILGIKCLTSTSSSLTTTYCTCNSSSVSPFPSFLSFRPQMD